MSPCGAAGEDLGYPQLAQLLRRVAPAQEIRSQQAQLFRRMVFNILMDNTDDHEKNHALLRQADGDYRLSQARQFGLKVDAACAIIREVAAKVACWKEAFSAQGVTANDMDLLAQYIDGDRLRCQREAFSAR